MEEYIKKQYLVSKITAICSVCMLLIILTAAALVVPRMMRTFEAVDNAIAKLDKVVEELDEVTAVIGPGMESLQTAAEGLQQIDFSQLNEAVESLKDVVDPLSRLFGN